MKRVIDRIKGFTLIELMVVIAIIGILATISIVGFSRYQSDTRDARRASSASAISEALEKYYDLNGEYPGCSQLTSPSTTVTGIGGALQGVNPQTLVAPAAPSDTSNSIQCTDLTSLSGPDFFSYVGDDSTACSSGNSCLSFTIKYKDEVNGQIKTISGRRNVNINTSGSVAISGSGVQFSSISLTLTNIQNNTGYAIQAATDSGFTTGLVNQTAPQDATSYNITGLTPGSTYYVRAATNSSTGQGTWSNVLVITVPHIATPVVTFTSTGPATASASWPAISGATNGYTIQRDTSSSFTAPTQTIQAGTTVNFSGLTPGTTYYVRVKATAPDDQSSWSTTKSITSAVPIPTTPTMTAAMSGSNAQGTTSATCSYGTVQYELHYHSQNTGTPGGYSAYTAWSSTTVLSVAALQGYQYTFQSQARCLMPGGATSTSVASAEVSTVDPIAQPATPVMSVDTKTWVHGQTHTVNYISYCPSGTSLSIGPDFAGQWMSSGFNWGDGVNYWGAWGSGDQWTFPSGYGSGSQIKYNTDYYCYTTYSTSPTSPVSYDYITVI